MGAMAITAAAIFFAPPAEAAPVPDPPKVASTQSTGDFDLTKSPDYKLLTPCQIKYYAERTEVQRYLAGRLDDYDLVTKFLALSPIHLDKIEFGIPEANRGYGALFNSTFLIPVMADSLASPTDDMYAGHSKMLHDSMVEDAFLGIVAKEAPTRTYFGASFDVKARFEVEARDSFPSNPKAGAVFKGAYDPFRFVAITAFSDCTAYSFYKFTPKILAEDVNNFDYAIQRRKNRPSVLDAYIVALQKQAKNPNVIEEDRKFLDLSTQIISAAIFVARKKGILPSKSSAEVGPANKKQSKAVQQP